MVPVEPKRWVNWRKNRVSKWDDYAKKPPLAGEAGCEWDADVSAARMFLCSREVSQKPVHVITEVQMVLLTAEIRRCARALQSGTRGY